MLYQFAADLVLLVHTLVVLFIVAGLLLILIGGFVNWHFVRKRWFRVLHLVAIGFVVVQAWLGSLCPLTILEMWLREQTGGVGVYEESFIQYWLQRLLYYDFPLWVFALAYTLFGLVVVIAWVRVPPEKNERE